MSVVAAENPGGGGLWARARVIAADIKLAHSVFAMPFAVLGAFLAWRGAGAGQGAGQAGGEESSGRFAGQLALIVLCMVAARTWAMLFNRLADWRYDAANPRTARRAIPSGRLTVRQGWAAAAGAAVAFVACASLFGVLFGNWWPAALSAPVLAWIAFYSLTKRFTALAHVFLGGALAASPLAAAIAVDPGALDGVPALWFVAGMVLLWVAGFDVIYALQDEEFDRGAGLRSIPARLGPAAALWVSRGLHAGALAMLLLAWRAEPRFGWLFGAGVGAVAALLALEHLILLRRGRAGLEMAFFTVNGVVSCVLGAAGCVDLVL
ncbi:MAG: 4-hydroxybenzoate octaprenyltransferase [Phycisphaerales bacterium]